MRSRNTRVRGKVVALLVSLTALWAFAGYVTLREGLNILWVTITSTNIGLPLDNVTNAMEQERKLSVLYVSGDDSVAARLPAARQATDDAVAELRRLASGGSIEWAASDDLMQRLNGFYADLDQLGALREAVDGRNLTGLAVVQRYVTIVDAAFLVNRSLASWDDQGLAQMTTSLVNLVYARELMAREDAIISGAIIVGELSQAERAAFTQTVGNRRFLHTSAVTGLTGDLRAQLQEILASLQYEQLESIENSIMTAEAGLGVSPSTWRSTADPMINTLREFEVDASLGAIDQATPVIIGTIIRLALLGVLGLAAVIASIVISITTARQLVRQLERLRNAARDLASYRLPRVVERLQQGEQVDVKQEAPPLEFGTDEIGQVGEAFNQVQETAIRVAVEQAELRRSVRDVFLSLARRSQALLHRQLGLLDAMERRTTDSEELAELFRIDHLATRMRRNAENLIVLSGATAGRAWRKPVPMVDVLRGALAEVEDYTRVTVLPVGNASLLGRAVGDVIHLLAELIENAVSFSPPQTTVRVGGSVVGYGFAIEIEDRGLGMTPEELAAANEQLRDPPEFRLTSTARLGLYVVAKLAERHGIRVRLAESPYGGTTAIVLLPGSIMAESESEETPDRSQLDSYRPAQLAGVGRHRLQTDADRPVRATVVTEQRPLRAQNGHVDGGALPVSAPASAAALPTRPRASQTEQADAAPPPAKETPPLTPSGLPWRQRRRTTDQQPTMPLPAGGQPQPGVTDAPPAGVTPRDPDTTRTKIASYRSGTLRGRSDAARLTAAAGAHAAPTGADATHDVPTGAVPTGAVPTHATSGGFNEEPARGVAQGPGLFPLPQPGAGNPGTGGADEYPLWASSTTDLPQWTQSTPRTTEEGG